MPRIVLDRLAGDRARFVRESVAANPATAEATLARLTNDHILRVRMLVAWNRSAPRFILRALLRDPHDAVRVAARMAMGLSVDDGQAV